MHAFRLSREEMTADLDASLAALGTDYIDIYLYHRDDPKRSVEELVETMENFVRREKIRYYGVSNWTLDRIQAAQDYAASRGLRGFVMNQALFNAGSDHMPAPSDDTLVKVDTQMQIYHRNLQNSSMDILCAGFSGNCGGFFQQYLKGGADAVRDKTYLTPENIKKAEQIPCRRQRKRHDNPSGSSLLLPKNRFSLHRPVRPQRRGGNRRGDEGILISSFLIPIFLPLPSPGADFSRERAFLHGGAAARFSYLARIASNNAR